MPERVLGSEGGLGSSMRARLGAAAWSMARRRAVGRRMIAVRRRNGTLSYQSPTHKARIARVLRERNQSPLHRSRLSARNRATWATKTREDRRQFMLKA